MTLQYFTPVEYPYLSIQGTTAPSFSNLLIDADGEAVAFIFRVTKAGSLRKIGCRTGTVTTGGDLMVEVQTVDTSTGDPTGTLWATNTSATLTVNAADDNVWKEATLTADATVAGDDVVAIVFRRPTSGTFNGILICPSSGTTSWIPRFFSSYGDNNASAVWTKSTSISTGIGVQYSDGVCYTITDMIPITNWQAITYNNTSSPDEYGNRFRVTVPCRCIGLALPADLDGDFTAVLYDDSGSQLAISNTFDKDIRGSANHGRSAIYFTSPYNLTASTWYRATILPTSATDLIIRKVTVNAAAWLGCMGGGTDFYQCTRTDAGAFSDSTVDRVMMSLILDQFDDATGSGGGAGPLVGTGRLIRN
jgi:hypothetical protein